MNKLSKRHIILAIKVSISMLCLLLLTVPYSLCYLPQDTGESETWVAVYVLQDLELSLLFLPFIFVWLIYLFLKNSIAKKAMTVLLLTAVGFYCLLGLASGGGQDTAPHIGMYLSLLLFPLLLGNTYFEFRKPISP
jgi:hypothetical protein